MRCHRPRGDGRNGDRMRLRRRWLTAERKQSLDTLEAPKPSGAELVKLESLRDGVSNDFPRRARNEHLSAVCCGGYPGRPVDGDANEATADHDRLTRVHAHAHAHRFGKALLVHRSLRPRRSMDRRDRTREDEHAAVAFTVDEPPAGGSAGVT